MTEAERVQLAAVAAAVANHGSALDANVRLLAEKVPALVTLVEDYERLREAAVKARAYAFRNHKEPGVVDWAWRFAMILNVGLYGCDRQRHMSRVCEAGTTCCMVHHDQVDATDAPWPAYWPAEPTASGEKP